MLFKSLEFKNAYGQKVKIIEIPVLEEDNTYRFMIQLRLEAFIAKVYRSRDVRTIYSFREYLKRVLKWSVYEQIFKTEVLKNNA
ncbi:YpmP family protein [Parageobacillus thermoglucosidasius]|uniref:YpmP family protein n=1 Tax=Parageobacillus thermoglucosidasius TaxID=1426 RepID=A0AB38R2N0_PARTM|nr:YpmP family protein [Parageobacillus thermoglucosidasius]UOE77944.1 YpmP family protein [Parageobacillus thermoglucosidasius]